MSPARRPRITRKPGSDPSRLPRTITIRGVAYGLLTSHEPGTLPMSNEAKAALVELSRNPNNEQAKLVYRTDPSIRVSSRRFQDKYALHGTPILDEHDHSRQVGIITHNYVEGDQLLIDAEVSDPAVIARVMDGEYTGLSIGYKPNTLANGSVVHTFREVSICSEPYFNNCLLTEIQASLNALQRAEAGAADSESEEEGKSVPEEHPADATTMSTPSTDNTASNAEVELAKYKAEMEKREQQIKELERQNAELNGNVERMTQSFVEMNKPRFLNVMKSLEAHKLDGLDQYKEHLADIFGEQENSSHASLIEKLTQIADGKDAELARVTKAMQERESELSKATEELTTTKETLDKYQAAVSQNNQYDSDALFRLHGEMADTPLPPDTRSHSTDTTKRARPEETQMGSMTPLEVTNSRHPNGAPANKRARNAPILQRRGQQELLAALNSTPLKTHASIARR